MTLYEVPFHRTGKNFPTVPNQRFSRGPGKAGAIARGIMLGYGYLKKHRNILTGISAIGVGAASQGGIEIDESTSGQSKTFNPTHTIHRKFRHRNYAHRRTVCRCTKRKYTTRSYRR